MFAKFAYPVATKKISRCESRGVAFRLKKATTNEAKPRREGIEANEEKRRISDDTPLSYWRNGERVRAARGRFADG